MFSNITYEAEYTATASMVVNSKSETLTQAGTAADAVLTQNLIPTYTRILQSEKIAKYVADGEAIGDDMTIYKNYASEKALETERYAQMADYTIQARAKAIPKTHVVTISK